jgi:hypothetical protein
MLPSARGVVFGPLAGKPPRMNGGSSWQDTMTFSAALVTRIEVGVAGVEGLVQQGARREPVADAMGGRVVREVRRGYHLPRRAYCVEQAPGHHRRSLGPPIPGTDLGIRFPLMEFSNSPADEHGPVHAVFCLQGVDVLEAGKSWKIAYASRGGSPQHRLRSTAATHYFGLKTFDTAPLNDPDILIARFITLV